MKKVYAGCDHGGHALKNELIKHLESLGWEVEDKGCYSEDSCNYPDYASAVCEAVKADKGALGLLVCGTGIGMSIAANKHKGIRAACCSDTYSAKLTREHNDANVLCFGARVVGEGLGLDLVDIFVDTEYAGGKHARRVAMLDELI